MIRFYRGLAPKIAASAYIDISAQVMGGVVIGAILLHGVGVGSRSIADGSLITEGDRERIRRHAACVEHRQIYREEL